MSDVRFDASFPGIARLLRSEMIGKALLERAEAVKSRAEEISPVGDETDPHAGRYKASFETELGQKLGRAEAIVRNTSPEAIRVEKGNSNIVGYHVLMRAIDILRRL